MPASRGTCSSHASSPAIASAHAAREDADRVGQVGSPGGPLRAGRRGRTAGQRPDGDHGELEAEQQCGGDPPARRGQATVGKQQQHGQCQRDHHGRGAVGAPHGPGGAGPVPGLHPRAAQPGGREARTDAQHQPAERVVRSAGRDQRTGQGPEDRQHDQLAGCQLARGPEGEQRDSDRDDPEAAGQHRPGPGRNLTQGARAVHTCQYASGSVVGGQDCRPGPDRHPEHVHAQPAEGDGQQQVRLQRTDRGQEEVPDEEPGQQAERHLGEAPGTPAGQGHQQQPDERPDAGAAPGRPG